ncbi:hypothetical protein TWF281_006853 [Arthrobotrys megalospora]
MSFASIPLTSHSAPIDEYIVLWTADKYKKLKKWHDGYLRYHTFNKRLMVYDHLMNKVCDKFLPEPEPIDVGDELVFDSHLITIEDVKGRQSQDLRPLFEKTVDRRKERGSIATPMRTTGTPGQAGQSPTPTLLRSIQSRPSTGHGHPIYPSPAPRRILKESPDPNAVVPQKRTSQGAPVVQKINYKPLKVSRVKESLPVPARPMPDNGGSATRNSNPNGKGRYDVELPPGLDLAADVLDADDDVEMLESDLEGGDFARRPKPQARTRPNAPPPFKPPRPRNNVRKGTTKESTDIEESPRSPGLSAVAAPPNRIINSLGSSPRIPPSTVTNYSQEPLSSPSFRSRPTNPPTWVQTNATEHVSSPVKRPSPIQSPDPPPEKEPEQLKRLTLPSATSRNRRKLLCGPSGRQNVVNKMVSLARPVSTLSILDTFPKDDASSESTKCGKDGVKTAKETSSAVYSSKPNTLNPSRKLSAKQTDPINQNALSQQPNKVRNGGSPASHWKPLWNYDDQSSDSASSDVRHPLHMDTTETQESPPLELNHKSNEKIQNRTSEIYIFSSDEEDLEVIITNPASKRPKKSAPIDSDASSDEFQPLRSSALPKHLIGQSRNAKLQSRQAVSEASRVWRGDGSPE